MHSRMATLSAAVSAAPTSEPPQGLRSSREPGRPYRRALIVCPKNAELILRVRSVTGVRKQALQVTLVAFPSTVLPAPFKATRQAQFKALTLMARVC